MNSPANVRSLEAIQDFKVTLEVFAEEVFQAMASLQQEINRIIDWLEHDRPRYWRQQVRVGFDRVAEARLRLAACKRREIGDYKPSCIEEQKDLEKAKRQLQIAQEKVELVRQWSIKFRHEYEEYKGLTTQLEHHVAGEIPRSLGLLVRILDALESYAEFPAVDEKRGIENSATVAEERVEETPKHKTLPKET